MPDSRIAPKPGSYLGFFEPKSTPCDAPRAGEPLDFSITVETAAYRISLYYGERDMLTVSPDGQHVLLLAGDLYRLQAGNVGQAVLALYAQRGPDFVRELNGAFSLILIDREADSLWIATDRCNSSKVLVRWDGATLVAANSIYLHSPPTVRLDRAAVASYLAAGFLYNDRTLLEDVRVLDGASVYRLRDGALTPRRYWTLEFAPASTSLEALKRELSERLIEAVKIRVRSDRQMIVSLSAGYDSRAITGVLARLGVPDVRCVSYAHGPIRPDSDEYLAGQIAALCGYRHEILPSFDGDAVRTLTRNAHLGGAMVQVCDEVDAWITLGKRVGGGPMPLLFTGDTPFIHHDMTMNSLRDVLYSAGISDFTALDWLEPSIGSATYREWVAATQADIDRAIRRGPPSNDLYDVRDAICIEQYVSHRVGNWREYFAGRFFKVTTPLLDNDILDLYARIPTEWRRKKRLFTETVKAMFPQLFSLPLAASAGYATFWTETLAKQKQSVLALINDDTSPLDDVIAPDILRAVLNSDLSKRLWVHELARPPFIYMYHLIKHTGFGKASHERLSLMTDKVSAQTFLLRALTLRRFAAEMANSLP